MKLIRVGNIYGDYGPSFAGNVYRPDGLSPALMTMGGGNRQPMIIEYGSDSDEEDDIGTNSPAEHDS